MLHVTVANFIKYCGYVSFNFVDINYEYAALRNNMFKE